MANGNYPLILLVKGLLEELIVVYRGIGAEQQVEEVQLLRQQLGPTLRSGSAAQRTCEEQ